MECYDSIREFTTARMMPNFNFGAPARRPVCTSIAAGSFAGAAPKEWEKVKYSSTVARASRSLRSLLSIMCPLRVVLVALSVLVAALTLYFSHKDVSRSSSIGCCEARKQAQVRRLRMSTLRIIRSFQRRPHQSQPR